MIRVCACESQPIVVEGLRRSLEDLEDLEFVGCVDKFTGPFRSSGEGLTNGLFDR